MSSSPTGSDNIKYKMLATDLEDGIDPLPLPEVSLGTSERLYNLCRSKWAFFLVFTATLTLFYVLTTGSVNSFKHTIILPRSHEEFNYEKLSSRVVDSIMRKFAGKGLLPGTTIWPLEAKLPKRVQLNDAQSLKLAELESNVAGLYWLDWYSNRTRWVSRDPSINDVTYCEKVEMVSPHNIGHSNLYWQKVDIPSVDQDVESGFSVYLYNAYYDNRGSEPMVKLITATNRQIPVEKTKLWCQLWFDDLRSPVLSTVTEVYDIWPEYWDFGVQDGVWGPQIMSCLVPKSYRNRVPRAISIQPNSDCSAPTNVLRVIYNQRNVDTKIKVIEQKKKKPSIGICVQAFRFRTYDVSVRLVEWLEMVRIMGGEKVYFYVYGATEAMYSVLRHYAKEGLVDWRHLTLPGDQPNIEPLYQWYYGQKGGKFWPQELLELNDCLYRNLYRHDYVIVFDIDEMIIPQPREMLNWHQLLEQVESELSESDQKTVGYLLNKHAYVYELFEEKTYGENGGRIPEYLYMMRHTYRGEVFKDTSNIKCFHRTSLVSAVHNHFPMRCLNTTGHHSCHGKYLDPERESFLMHYRRNRSPPENCNKTGDSGKQCTVHDTTAWKYRDLLEPAVKRKLDLIFSKPDRR